jgi:hypothetical protein
MTKMLGQRGHGVGQWLVLRVGGGLVLLLCLSVFLQMLGVPAPLLDAAGSFEVDQSSALEGWSILTLSPQLPTFPDFVLVADSRPFACVPILAGAFFRPPLS